MNGTLVAVTLAVLIGVCGEGKDPHHRTAGCTLKVGLRSTQSLAKKTGTVEIVSKEVIMSRDDCKLNFPFLHEAASGPWYMTYREGPHNKPGGDRVQCVFSTARGKSWHKWEGLEARPNLRLFRTRLSDGTLISHHYVAEDVNEGRATIYILRSNDDGANWVREKAEFVGLPFEIDEPLGLWGHIAEMEDGRLLCGIYGSRKKELCATKQDKYERRCFNGVVESLDGGKHWRYISNLICGPKDLNMDGNEMDLVRLRSGDLVAVSRTSDLLKNLYQVRSQDGGRTWSNPQDLQVDGVSPQLLELENGVLVLTFGSRYRRHHFVKVSWDGSGYEWSLPVLIHAGRGRGYFDVQRLSPNSFRLVFDQVTPDPQDKRGRIMRAVIRVRPL